MNGLSCPIHCIHYDQSFPIIHRMTSTAVSSDTVDGENRFKHTFSLVHQYETLYTVDSISRQHSPQSGRKSSGPEPAILCFTRASPLRGNGLDARQTMQKSVRCCLLFDTSSTTSQSTYKYSSFVRKLNLLAYFLRQKSGQQRNNIQVVPRLADHDLSSRITEKACVLERNHTGSEPVLAAVLFFSNQQVSTLKEQSESVGNLFTE